VTLTSRAAAQAAADAYRPGRPARCFLDPVSGRAVLRRSPLGSAALVLLPLLFAVAPWAAVVLLWRWRPRDRRIVAPQVGSDRVGRPEPVLLPLGGVAPSRQLGVPLRPGLGPFGRLVAATAAALFWNGIVSVFVVQLAGEWRAGAVPIFGSLFLVPFVVVGLGLVAAVGYCLLATLNPRPRLVLAEAVVPVGGSTLLRWGFAGRTARMVRLNVTLQGREEATYRQGTDTKTDTEVFSTTTLVDTTNAWEIAQGETRVTVPAGTMHSFAADHNKVVWVLALHGEIPSWPDVKEELEIAVVPALGPGEAT
jgi:hypothetical protein